MDKPTFWKIIDASRKQARGDLDAQLETLRSRLERLEPDEIVQFGRFFEDHHIRAYTWDLWAAAYMIGGGCSDDGFLDFRGWLISKGEKVYERALKNAESLVQVVNDDDEDTKFEGFQYVASQAWEKKTGKSAHDFPDHGLSYAPDPSGERWTEDGDDLERRFPKLWKRFSAPRVRRWIRIVAAPPGEAPEAVRAAWIGCLLPLLEGRESPERGEVSGVTSGRPEDHGLGYVVPAREAIAALARHDAKAARWWHERAPHMLEPGKLLIFSSAVCELMPEAGSK